MTNLGFPVLPMCELHQSDFLQEDTSEQEGSSRWQTALEGWMGAHDLTMESDSFVVKPAEDSAGEAVLLVNDLESVAQHAQYIFDQVKKCREQCVTNCKCVGQLRCKCLAHSSECNSASAMHLPKQQT